MSMVRRTMAVAAMLSLSGGALLPAAQQHPPSSHRPEGAHGRQHQPGQGWDAFATAFDANKDGKIAKEEFLAKAPAFDILDTNKDGAVTKEEVQARPAAQKNPGIGNFLARFDSNKDGKVVRAEWDEKRAKTFAKADRNADGFIEKDEFVAAAKELNGGGA